MNVSPYAPTVFVVQDSGRKNLLPALKYGKLEALLQGQDELNLLNGRQIMEKIRFGLQKMTSQDYIMLIGNPVSIGLAFAIATEVTGGEFKVLVWDKQETMYYELQVNLKRGEPSAPKA